MAKKKESVRDLLRVRPGLSDPTAYPTDEVFGAPGSKAKTLAALTGVTGPAIAELQEKFFAASTVPTEPGSERRILLVLQGMDTSGKGGVIDHVVGQLGPSGTSVASFKKPTPEELAHHFLWRIRRKLPAAGQVGVFDRSHYEDVLVVKVHAVIDDDECARRYDEINQFEAGLVATGTTVIKCFLNISYDEQRSRLLARLDDPTKHWKFREGDIDERGFWPDYMAAYSEVLSKTSTDVAPWYVIPSDRKWYRNWVISELLRETLAEIDPKYPATDLDVRRLQRRLKPPN
ncbi:MAG: polyphosphate kinase 2 family protein [Pseudonocardiales bacterium]|nr:polyphosphate kinase 2 family protein [Pseudonocardiales bacterium]